VGGNVKLAACYDDQLTLVSGLGRLFSASPIARWHSPHPHILPYAMLLQCTSPILSLSSEAPRGRGFGKSCFYLAVIVMWLPHFTPVHTASYHTLFTAAVIPSPSLIRLLDDFMLGSRSSLVCSAPLRSKRCARACY